MSASGKFAPEVKHRNWSPSPCSPPPRAVAQATTRVEYLMEARRERTFQIYGFHGANSSP